MAWLSLPQELRADQLATALMREQIAVPTAGPFATSIGVPHARRLAMRSVDLDTLRDARQKVKRAIDAQA